MWSENQSTADNRAGRIVLQEDATGAQEFFYGPLGEVVKNIRTVVIPNFDEQTYVTEWKYDTWNRLTSLIYADGEEVTYNYNSGGLLRSMTGKKKNATYNYVNQLGYDKFEQRVFLAHGNGTKTTYDYEADRRRLKNMTAQTTAKRLFMDNLYTYDKVNNILGLKNNAPVPSPNLMGGSSEYSYEYDDLYRLTKAQGSFKGANDAHTYTLSVDYNSVGGITHKSQNHLRKGNEQKKTTYDLNYVYSSEQPHAPVHIGEQTYTYDASGNQTGWKDDKTGQRRKIMWDEENRVRSIYDNGSQHHYIYDAAGERVIKGKSTGQRIFVNGEWKAGSGQMGNYTVYVNPYIVLKSGGYTKHYYIEGQRIVSKLGGGWDNNGKGPLKAGGNKVDYVSKSQKVFDGIVKNLKFLGADGQILTAGKSGKIPPGQINGTGGSVAESFRYFYHPDHLGSTSYVTDASGEVYQHLEYFAFGETFVEEHSNTDRTPYLFNGKEQDEETGLYYYGARYYDAQTSVWLAVDPFAEKFAGESPYIYTSNNPVAAIDPDGREEIVVTGGEYSEGTRYKYNFVEPSIKKLKELVNAGKGEPITWAVMNVGYSDSEIDKFKSIAKDLGVGFQLIGSADEFTNYLNSKNVSDPNLSAGRQGDKVSNMTIFGHGFSGSSAEFGYHQGAALQAQFSWGTDDASKLNANAFNNSTITLYTCNSATDSNESWTGGSLARTIADKTSSNVSGYWGRSDYAKINSGESKSDKLNRFFNEFNTGGSRNYPSAGFKSTGEQSTWITIKRQK